MSHRDPYPPIRPENEYAFTGARQQQRATYDKPTHIAQDEEPWSRLYHGATFSSIRRSVIYQVPPKDKLDLHLNSTYDQHKDFLCNKNQTCYQKESEHQRGMLMNDEEKAPQTEQEGRLRVWVNPQKCSIHSIRGTIESHHNASTNRGYTRNDDGSFFST